MIYYNELYFNCLTKYLMRFSNKIDVEITGFKAVSALEKFDFLYHIFFKFQG